MLWLKALKPCASRPVENGSLFRPSYAVIRGTEPLQLNGAGAVKASNGKTKVFVDLARSPVINSQVSRALHVAHFHSQHLTGLAGAQDKKDDHETCRQTPTDNGHVVPAVWGKRRTQRRGHELE